MLWNIIKWFLFRMDAETAHRITVLLIRLGIRFGSAPLEWVSGGISLRRSRQSDSQKYMAWGIEFRSRLGLAAGFDKNAELLTALPALGFGFVEIGTVTPRPQAGNSRPRLFRDPSNEALFNRMGFNGLGATIISERIAQAKEDLPENFRIGVNLGKNKDTPLERAWEDYARSARAFKGLADYLVINVSSPNTPGLRSLQTVEALKPIVGGVVEIIQSWEKKPPLLLKIAPELSGGELTELIQTVEPWGIDGWVLTNTLGGTLKNRQQELQGGWSGKPLKDLARLSLKEVRQVSHQPIISVGGITSVEEAMARISGGANLLQVYTGWIYRGPTFPVQVTRALETQKPQAFA